MDGGEERAVRVVKNEKQCTEHIKTMHSILLETSNIFFFLLKYPLIVVRFSKLWGRGKGLSTGEGFLEKRTGQGRGEH